MNGAAAVTLAMSTVIAVGSNPKKTQGASCVISWGIKTDNKLLSVFLQIKLEGFFFFF